MSSTAWIAVDWGTSHLRAWRMSADDTVLERLQSEDGMARVPKGGFDRALQALVGAFSGPVVACGMVGSRQGWVEAPYDSVPCHPPSAKDATRMGNIHILPGLSQAKPADVMRGEETQIAGFFARHQGFDGVICLPGTHSKWVQVSAGEVVSFRTAMTGELYALLTEQSVLKHSVGPGWEAAAFEAAVADGLSRPEALSLALFNIRAQGLVGQGDQSAARSRLSGLLIGAELAATRAYWLGQAVALVGDDALCQVYAAALRAQGVTALIEDGEAMVLAGLIAAKAALELT